MMMRYADIVFIFRLFTPLIFFSIRRLSYATLWCFAFLSILLPCRRFRHWLLPPLFSPLIRRCCLLLPLLSLTLYAFFIIFFAVFAFMLSFAFRWFLSFFFFFFFRRFISMLSLLLFRCLRWLRRLRERFRFADAAGTSRTPRSRRTLTPRRRFRWCARHAEALLARCYWCCWLFRQISLIFRSCCYTHRLCWCHADIDSQIRFDAIRHALIACCHAACLLRQICEQPWEQCRH